MKSRKHYTTARLTQFIKNPRQTHTRTDISFPSIGAQLDSTRNLSDEAKEQPRGPGLNSLVRPARASTDTAGSKQHNRLKGLTG